MRVLGIIPARGGSKGLPNKHFLEIGGLSLLQRAMESARESTLLTNWVVSTDSTKIAIHAGVAQVILRPPELATDTAGMIPVLQHALQYTERSDAPYDLIVCLQPTSPFRTGADIDATVQLVQETGADSAQTLCEAAYRPWQMVLLSGSQCLPVFPDAAHRDLRRQDPPGVYQPSGAVYVTRRQTLVEEHRIIGRNHHGLVIPYERSINVNTPWDFRIAEMMYARGFQP